MQENIGILLPLNTFKAILKFLNIYFKRVYISLKDVFVGLWIIILHM